MQLPLCSSFEFNTFLGFFFAEEFLDFECGEIFEVYKFSFCVMLQIIGVEFGCFLFSDFESFHFLSIGHCFDLCWVRSFKTYRILSTEVSF